MPLSFFFFFNDTATTEIYTLSLHDALPISPARERLPVGRERERADLPLAGVVGVRERLHLGARRHRSEEHTSELQSPCNLVCRLLLEKKKKQSYSSCSHTLRASKRTYLHYS